MADCNNKQKEYSRPVFVIPVRTAEHSEACETVCVGEAVSWVARSAQGEGLKCNNQHPSQPSLIREGASYPLYLWVRGQAAFTLTEVLLAIVIVGVIAALVLPAIVTHFQEKGFDQAYVRETKTIESAIQGLAVNENKASFFETMMYSSEEPESYEDNAEIFLKKYLRVSKICGDNNSDCFGKTYYQYIDSDKKLYTPEFKGSCASLKNGASICITPQVGAAPITGIIDLNGQKGPNIFGKDLRTFAFSSITQAGRNTQVAAVLDTEFTPLETDEGYDPCKGMTCGCGTLPECDPCEGKTCGCGSLPPCEVPCPSNPNDWDLTCCQKNASSITSYTHHCCMYSSIKNTVDNCIDKSVTINFNCTKGIPTGYNCNYSISGYNQDIYRIFIRCGSGVECTYAGNRVDCNNYYLYYNSDYRIFNKSNPSHNTKLCGSGCDIYKNYQLLASYDMNSCKSLTFKYTP